MGKVFILDSSELSRKCSEIWNIFIISELIEFISSR